MWCSTFGWMMPSSGTIKSWCRSTTLWKSWRGTGWLRPGQWIQFGRILFIWLNALKKQPFQENCSPLNHGHLQWCISIYSRHQSNLGKKYSQLTWPHYVILYAGDGSSGEIFNHEHHWVAWIVVPPDQIHVSLSGGFLFYACCCTWFRWDTSHWPSSGPATCRQVAELHIDSPTVNAQVAKPPVSRTVVGCATIVKE